MAYNLGIFVRALYESIKPKPENMPQPLLPSAPVLLALPAAKPERTMIQRLDAITGRQAERQVPSAGVILLPPATTLSDGSDWEETVISRKLTQNRKPNREPARSTGRKKPTTV